MFIPEKRPKILKQVKKGHYMQNYHKKLKAGQCKLNQCR